MRYLGFNMPNHTEIHARRSFVLAMGEGALCQDSSACPTDNPSLTWQLLLRLTGQGYCLPFLEGCKNIGGNRFCFVPHAIFQGANGIWDWKPVSVSSSPIKSEAWAAIASLCVPSATPLGRTPQSLPCCHFVGQLLETLCKLTVRSIPAGAMNELPAFTPSPLNGSWNKGKWRESEIKLILRL